MRNLRSHAFDASGMFDFHMAADARLCRTNYADDQAWSLDFGSRGRAALALQTQFGGRAGLASIVPIWQTQERRVYELQDYWHAPIVTHFAPNFMRVRAEIAPWLELVARYWVMESTVAGGEFAIENHSEEDKELRLELFGHVVINGRNQQLNVLTLGDYSLALHLGQIGNINPVLTLEGASIEIYGGRISSPKLGRDLLLPAGETTRVPFVIAGLPDMRDSVSVAMNWMSRPWEDYFERINRAAAAVPKISTGNDDWDTLIELSYNLLLKSFMSANDGLPHASIVANRRDNRGWSRRGDGSDHIRAWSGQDPTLAYLAAAAVATIEPQFAKGILLNYLATQDESGFVDRQPGLAGQRQGLLMMPLLARLAWIIYQVTEDREFIADIMPRLLLFFDRWLQEDDDADGVPEWRSERQMGYIAFPTFGRGQGWAQGAEVAQMETPDLLTYLISEANALCHLARVTENKPVESQLTARLHQLQDSLESLWDGNRYIYRDRDTHLSGPSTELLYGGAGDQLHVIERDLPQPGRIAVRVVGGVSQVPRIQMRLTGKDLEGVDCVIEADADEFDWRNRQGVYTTKPLSYLASIEVIGLSRVYKVYARTIDSSRLDINHLIPLWNGTLSEERAEALAQMAMDEEQFLCPNGITMVSQKDNDFDPSNARGGGGIWMFWLALIGEGLLKAGYRKEATRLIKRVMTSLCKVLERDGKLSQFYHAVERKGFGEEQHLGGIVPLKLLTDVIGVQIVSPAKVLVGGAFSWEAPIRVEQHGVIVCRDADKIDITFPSGHKATLAADVEWQAVLDPEPAEPAEQLEPLPAPPAIPSAVDSDDEDRILIDIDPGAQSGEPNDEVAQPAPDQVDKGDVAGSDDTQADLGDRD